MVPGVRWRAYINIKLAWWSQLTFCKSPVDSETRFFIQGPSFQSGGAPPQWVDRPLLSLSFCRRQSVRLELNDGPRRATTRMQWVASGCLEVPMSARPPAPIQRCTQAAAGCVRHGVGRGVQTATLKSESCFFGISLGFSIYAFTSAHTMGQYSNVVQKTQKGKS
jgi:hypothetical protein